MAKKQKREALTVGRFINEFLIEQLGIPVKKIVNDTTFSKYTGSKRPDLLISQVEYSLETNNDDEFISNLIAYAEAKDNCSVGDIDWQDAITQGKEKAKKLNIPYYIVTNCKVSYFYNTKNGMELKLNGHPIREFQDLNVLNIIITKLEKDPDLIDIKTNTEIKSHISEATFNKKLWELANIYRSVDFKNITEKIDFTIGFIALKFFEEKAIYSNTKDRSKDYWSDLKVYIKKKDSFIKLLAGYIETLEKETDFKEFIDLMEIVRNKIQSNDISSDDVIEIYNIVESMGELHESNFDLFGAVYEMFASNKEKGDFGEFFTRRHYTHIFTKLLLKDEKYFNNNKKFVVLDPACGTGGFLTEAFKILHDNYQNTGTYNEEAERFIKNECFYGFDIKEENVSRTKLNMFLVGDGHTHIEKKDSLREQLPENHYDYILTNPPYGNGIERAETSVISTSRYEIAFIAKIIKLLKVGGKACIITPDGFFENPRFELFRKEVLEKCNIFAIVSLPKFAFAPYTKEKTYALFLEKRSATSTKVQTDDVWFYIIDNDGYANSDKRFPTRLQNEDGTWLHDEVSGWVNTEAESEDEILQPGYLEKRWLKYDDSSNPTSWIDEKGEKVVLRKAGFIKIKDILDSNFLNLLPELYLRPYEPTFITKDEIDKEINKVEMLVKGLLK